MNGESRGVEWEVISASRFPEGLSQVKNAIVEEKAWAVVASKSTAALLLP
jgi:hypothetical protein